MTPLKCTVTVKEMIVFKEVHTKVAQKELGRTKGNKNSKMCILKYKIKNNFMYTVHK